MICEKKSYAKINLSLRIIRKKRNGYHILKSLMSLIDFYDEITFEECDDIKVETDPFVCEEKDNYTEERKEICKIVNKYAKFCSKS